MPGARSPVTPPNPSPEVNPAAMMQQPQATSVPSPDPTLLTTQLVDRALSAFREVVETRLNGLAVAVELAAEKTDAVPVEARLQRQELYEELSREIQALRELLVQKIETLAQQSHGTQRALEHDMGGLKEVFLEKFTGIDTRFQERDERAAQSAIDSRISLDAALAAAKEAVSEQNAANAKAIAKSEDATQKQIDSNKTLMDTSLKSLQDQIVDMRGRLDTTAGKSTGLNAGWAYIVAAGGMAAAVVAIAISLRP